MIKKKRLPNTKFGVTKKKTINNFQVERFKAYKVGDIGSICVKAWCRIDQYTSKDAIQRYFDRQWALISSNTLKGSDVKSFLVLSINGQMDDRYHFSEFTLQFSLKGLGHKFDEGIWEILEEDLLEVIKGSKLIIRD